MKRNKAFDPETELYLFCFAENPVGNSAVSHGTATHYLGSCKKGKFYRRFLAHVHLMKDGAKLIRALVMQEKDATVMILAETNGAALEAYYKRRKHNFRKICPSCNGGQWKELNPYKK